MPGNDTAAPLLAHTVQNLCSIRMRGLCLHRQSHELQDVQQQQPQKAVERRMGLGGMGIYEVAPSSSFLYSTI